MQYHLFVMGGYRTMHVRTTTYRKMGMRKKIEKCAPPPDVWVV